MCGLDGRRSHVTHSQSNLTARPTVSDLSDRAFDPACSPPARSDRFDAGLNEAIAARLARPTRVMGEDDRFVGIQIVYGQPSSLTLDASPSPNNRPSPILSPNPIHDTNPIFTQPELQATLTRRRRISPNRTSRCSPTRGCRGRDSWEQISLASRLNLSTTVGTMIRALAF